MGALTFRHAAEPVALSDEFEISGHFHPKLTLSLRGRRISRRCFLMGERRLILPAFGAYAGGLDAADPVFDPLLGPDATVIPLSRAAAPLPRPRARA